MLGQFIAVIVRDRYPVIVGKMGSGACAVADRISHCHMMYPRLSKYVVMRTRGHTSDSEMGSKQEAQRSAMALCNS